MIAKIRGGNIMNKCVITIFLFTCFFCNQSIFGQDEEIEQILQKKLDKKQSEEKTDELRTIDFKFKDADLVDVINYLASEKNVNVILPMGAMAIKSKLNINMAERLSIEEAWDLLHTVLDISGYSMLPKGNMFSIVKTDPNIAREPMQIYVSTPIKQIPNTDERIIYLAYFSNIRVADAGQTNGQSLVSKVLKEFVSKEVEASFKIVPEANGVVIIDKASNIRSIMKILIELDKVGFREQIEIIGLNYAVSDVVAKLFNEQIMAQKRQNRYRLGARKRSEVSYFDSGAKIISESRTNSLILIGMQKDIERIKDFVANHIDVPMDTGRSVLHRKKLSYLDAERLANVLQLIVGAAGQQGAQSRPGGGGGFGPERFFEGVIIETDKPKEGEGTPEEGKYRYSGTNSLIVAAKKDDWERIEKLIDKLDQPKRQIIIEVLIADLSLDQSRFLGSAIRNHSDIPWIRFSNSGQSFNAQSAQIVGTVTDPPIGDSGAGTTIAGDLMNQKVANPFVEDASASANRGSTLFSISDKEGSVWSVLRVLNLFGHSKILSHPYIVSVNNVESEVNVGQTRRVDGEGEKDTSGTVTIKKEDLEGNLVVKIRPRIGGESAVNLEVSIDINEFTEGISGDISAGDRIQREIKTNANIKSGDILVLGGLIRVNISQTTRPVPILGSIPVLGWFFKSKQFENEKNNLTVFIRPTVVEPMLRAGIGDYTKDYIKVAKQHSREGMLFDTLRDPINRWFFKTDVDAEDAVDIYTEMYEKKPGEEKVTLIDIIEGDDMFLAENKSFKKSKSKVQAVEEDEFEKIEVPLTDPKVVVAKNKPKTTESKDLYDDELKTMLSSADNPFA